MGTTALRERGTDPSRLTDKQRKFCAEYPKDFNSTRAAIEAGYSKRTAAVMGCKLLKNTKIQAAMGKMCRLDWERAELERGEVLRQLRYALTRQERDFFDKNDIPLPPSKLPEQCQSIVDEYKCKVLRTDEDGDQLLEITRRLTPHATAREQALKHMGLFEPTQVDVRHMINWDSLHTDGKGQIDTIEAKILKEEQE